MSRPFLALTLLLTACKPHGDGDTDTDVAVDTEPVTGTVTVYVEDGPGAPAAGITVVFHDADGGVLTTATTDAAGQASAEITGEGGVTAVLPTQIRTVLGVFPGDEVRLADWVESLVTMEPTTHVEVAAHAGADGYRLSAGCAGESRDTVVGGFDVPTGTRCRYGADRVDLFAVAYDGVDPLAYTSSIDVPVGAAVTLPTPWRTDWSTRTIAVEDAPTGAAEVYAGVSFRRHGRNFHTASGTSSVDGVGGAAVLLKAPVGFAEETETVVFGQYDLGAGVGGFGQLFRRADGDVPDSLTVVGDELPSPPQTVSIDATDVARPVFTWTGGSVEDARVIGFAAQGTGGSLSWYVAAPGDRTEIQAPALPDTLAALRPTIAPPAHLVHGMTVDGLTARELLVGWSVLARFGTFAPYGDAFRGGRVTQRMATP